MEKFFPKNINYLKNTSDDMLHKRVADIFLYNPIKKGIVICIIFNICFCIVLLLTTFLATP